MAITTLEAAIQLPRMFAGRTSGDPAIPARIMPAPR
jgi:hypothetical protein